MKAYRPYETFGMIDDVRHFDTIDSLVDYYTPWCKENNIQLEVAMTDDIRVVFAGTNDKYYDELINEYSIDEAADLVVEFLIVKDCTENEVAELSEITIP
jgi:hypothetical protein